MSAVLRQALHDATSSTACSSEKGYIYNKDEARIWLFTYGEEYARWLGLPSVLKLYDEIMYNGGWNNHRQKLAQDKKAAQLERLAQKTDDKR